jgi:exoribonuclease-2
MLPPQLAEELCSLKAGEIRPAISIMANLSRSAEIMDYEIFPSLVKVKEQLTYHDVNIMAEENKDIRILREIAEAFRRDRLARGAVQISLPDINIQLTEDGKITVNKINRGSPARILVEELMILANWLMARFLKEQDMPAIFRSQPDPKARLYKGTNGTLYQNYMQRRQLSRFVLDHKPERHSGLGLNAYVTATSPIRKYFDLITQRQIRAAFDLEIPYTVKDMDSMIHMLKQPMTNILGIQYRRKRYWLLKYLENKTGEKNQAIVLFKRRSNYQVLLPDYMTECNLPVSSSIELRPEDIIQVTIQHANARKDTLSIFLG